MRIFRNASETHTFCGNHFKISSLSYVYTRGGAFLQIVNLFCKMWGWFELLWQLYFPALRSSFSSGLGFYFPKEIFFRKTKQILIRIRNKSYKSVSLEFAIALIPLWCFIRSSNGHSLARQGYFFWKTCFKHIFLKNKKSQHKKTHFHQEFRNAFIATCTFS